MTSVPFPWIELSVVLPLIGAVWVSRLREPDVARLHSLWISGLTLVTACAAWLSLDTTGQAAGLAYEQWDFVSRMVGHDLLVIDELSAPLLPLAALLFLLTELATLRTKVRRFSFCSVLLSEAILLATLACKQPWAIVLLLAAGTIPPWIELRVRQRPTRVYEIHMAVFVA